MVQAWFYDEAAPGDQRAPHQFSPSRGVSLEELAALGVEYFRVDVDQDGYMDTIEKMCAERNYQNRDLIAISRETLPNYDEKIKTFFEEHIHEDEEIRFILDGSGYFDVRDKEDKWIRIAVEKSDLIIVPAGIYHRFTLDENNWIKAMRLFAVEPKWIPIPRPVADENPYRKEFLAKYVEATA